MKHEFYKEKYEKLLDTTEFVSPQQPAMSKPSMRASMYVKGHQRRSPPKYDGRCNSQS